MSNTRISGHKSVIGLEEGWKVLEEEGIEKLKRFLRDDISCKTRDIFKHAEYSTIYTKCYDMCTQRTPYNWSEQLYTRHGLAIEAYLQKVSVPCRPGTTERQYYYPLPSICERVKFSFCGRERQGMK